jgi:hypothetical protein
MNTHKTTPDQAAALLALADPIEKLSRLVDPDDLDAAAVRLLQHIDRQQERTLSPRRRTRARRVRVGWSLRIATGGSVVAAVAVLAFALAEGTPGVSTAAAETIRRAASALLPSGESILHLASTLTTTSTFGPNNTAYYESWQQLKGTTCTTRTLSRTSFAGSADGVSVQTHSGGQFTDQESLYDPSANTIYVPPAVRGSTPGDLGACDTRQFPVEQIRRHLANGSATVVGRATIDGVDTIEITYTFPASSHVKGEGTYYAAADGSYRPVESVETVATHGVCQQSASVRSRLRAWLQAHPGGGLLPRELRPNNTCGTGEQTQTTVYHSYEELPASDTAVFNLTAVYPTAKVVTGPAAVRLRS